MSFRTISEASHGDISDSISNSISEQMLNQASKLFEEALISSN